MEPITKYLLTLISFILLMLFSLIIIVNFDKVIDLLRLSKWANKREARLAKKFRRNIK